MAHRKFKLSARYAPHIIKIKPTIPLGDLFYEEAAAEPIPNPFQKQLEELEALSKRVAKIRAVIDEA